MPGRQLAIYELTALALRTPALRDLARRQYAGYREAATEVLSAWLDEERLDLPGGGRALGELMTVVIDGMTLAWPADPEGSDPHAVFTLLDALVTRAAAPVRLAEHDSDRLSSAPATCGRRPRITARLHSVAYQTREEKETRKKTAWGGFFWGNWSFGFRMGGEAAYLSMEGALPIYGEGSNERPLEV